VVGVAREIVKDCPSDCGSSCMDCLCTFRNTYYHQYLNRQTALQKIDALGSRLIESHSIPPIQPTEEPGEDSYPVNEAERKLRQALLAKGFPEGKRGEQIRLDRAIGTTTPDVIYRAEHHDENEGVCIYLDGLSKHIHGNPKTSERDRLIRGWLSNNGYDVLEIAYTELDDKEAMRRKFRKLAGYLQLNEIRENLRNNSD
jgi:hypothetical protein